MTITLTPSIETRLRRKAAQTGQNANVLAEMLLSDALADEVSEEYLREEYHQLAALELKDSLSSSQAERLREVIAALDKMDSQSPGALAMTERLGETERKLDEMLDILRTLPLSERAA